MRTSNFSLIRDFFTKEDSLGIVQTFEGLYIDNLVGNWYNRKRNLYQLLVLSSFRFRSKEFVSRVTPDINESIFNSFVSNFIGWAKSNIFSDFELRVSSIKNNDMLRFNCEFSFEDRLFVESIIVEV